MRSINTSDVENNSCCESMLKVSVKATSIMCTTYKMCMKLITYVTTNSCWQNVILLDIASYFIRHLFFACDHTAIQKTYAQIMLTTKNKTAKTNNQKKTTT